MPDAGAHHTSERPWFPVPVRVRYAETDAQQVVYHANYLVYMEVARGAFTRSVGLPYQEIEARGFHLVVADAKLRYKASAGYDDPLVVLLRIKELRGRLVRFEYRIEHEETGRLLVTGETSHVCVGRDFRPQPIPDWVVQALGGPVVPTAAPGGGG
jgi:acyl-CoA thioester hydrolase